MENPNPEIKFKIIDPDYSGLTLKEIEFARIPDAYGVTKPYKLDLMIREEADVQNRPVVFFVHGGGFMEPCDKRQSYISLFAQELTRHGYAVVSPDYPVFQSRTDLNTMGGIVLRVLWLLRHCIWPQLICMCMPKSTV